MPKMIYQILNDILDVAGTQKKVLYMPLMLIKQNDISFFQETQISNPGNPRSLAAQSTKTSHTAELSNIREGNYLMHSAI